MKDNFERAFDETANKVWIKVPLDPTDLDMFQVQAAVTNFVCWMKDGIREDKIEDPNIVNTVQYSLFNRYGNVTLSMLKEHLIVVPEHHLFVDDSGKLIGNCRKCKRVRRLSCEICKCNDRTEACQYYVLVHVYPDGPKHGRCVKVRWNPHFIAGVLGTHCDENTVHDKKIGEPNKKKRKVNKKQYKGNRFALTLLDGRDQWGTYQQRRVATISNEIYNKRVFQAQISGNPINEKELKKRITDFRELWRQMQIQVVEFHGPVFTGQFGPSPAIALLKWIIEESHLRQHILTKTRIKSITGKMIRG